mgnify:CR=1 FL=1
MSKLTLKSIKEAQKLLKTYARILNGLNAANIVRTYNSPIGDYAESLVTVALGLKKADKEAKGFDAVDKEGKKYQIKARWIRTPKQSKRFSPIRNLKKREFDYLIGIYFDKEFQVSEAWKIPIKVLLDLDLLDLNKKGKGISYSRHTRGHIVYLKGEVVDDKRSDNITKQLKRKIG